MTDPITRILNGEKPPAGCKTREEYQGNYRKYLIGWFKEPIKVQK